jgi:hypothetical protein
MSDNFMNSQELQLLNLRNLPARLKAEEVACLLGFKSRDIPLLVAGGLLKPLGHPPTTGVKYFASVVIEECRRDAKWLAQASDYVVRYWRAVNQKRKGRTPIVKANKADSQDNRWK